MRRDTTAPYLAALASVLGALTLLPVLSSPSWLPPVLLLVGLVLVSGLALRALTRSPALVLLGQCAVGLVGLTVLFARDSAVLGLLPGPEALRSLAQLGQDGRDATRRYSTPAPPVVGIRFLVGAGVLAVAIAVDFLAVTWGTAVAAGLPLLALYCVPAALLPHGASAFSFLLVAGGWLLMLSHDGRLRVNGWGRILNKYPDGARRRFGENDLDALSSSARRLGVLTLAAAVTVPLLLPSLSNGLLTSGGSGDGSGSGNGHGSAVSVDPILTLRQNLTARSSAPVLTFSTAQTNPPTLRLVTDDRFDGETWRTRDGRPSSDQSVSTGVPEPLGLSGVVATTTYRMKVNVSTLAQSYLPVPYPVRTVDVDGPWVYAADTLDVSSPGRSTRGLAYSLTYLDVQPTIAQLREAPAPPQELKERYTELPAGLSSTILKTALKVTAGATTSYDKAAALQAWFRTGGGFVYDTDVSATETRGDAVSAFLSSRHGYCVQFSSAMAVMARMLGIPARIGVGFLPGQRRSDGSRAVSLNDAHAWPELYFEGAGWVRFEPTPAVRTGAPPTYTEQTTTDPSFAPSVSAGATAGATTSVDPLAALRQHDLTPTGASAVPSASSNTGHHLFGHVRLVVLALLVVLLALAAPATALLARRRRRARAHDAWARVETAWTELLEGLADLGVELPPGSTPRQMSARLEQESALDGESLTELVHLRSALEEARYSGRTPSFSSPADLAAAVQTVLQGVRARCDLSARLRARVLPRSGTDRLLRLSSRAAEQVSRMDRSIARTGRSVTRGPRSASRRTTRRRVFKRDH